MSDMFEVQPDPALQQQNERWRAVQLGERAADGKWIYGVRTTGIYCRPSCPSRQPKRSNVVFFDTSAAARAAGFRPCKRCQPDIAASDRLHNCVVMAAARMIDAAVASQRPVPALALLAAHAGFSPFHFHRLFQQTLGLTPKAYGIAARAQGVAQHMQASASVTHAIHAAGYGSSSRFYATSTARLGMKPARNRRGGEGETIHFAIAACSLGLVLVAATAKGVCAITLGDDAGGLADALEARFPLAALVSADAGFSAVVAQVVGLVEAPGLALDLSLDVRGTAFQERVWQALQTIPAGTTATYAQIAARIGAPTATRAVAQACGANPAAIIIPCHRVVRSDGGLSGYRWGVSRKAALLEREGAR